LAVDAAVGERPVEGPEGRGAVGRVQVQAAGGRAAAHLAPGVPAPDAVAHVRIGRVVDARLAKVRDVLQVAVDHAVAVRQAQGHGGHVVQLDVLQAVDLQAPLLELFAHRL